MGVVFGLVMMFQPGSAGTFTRLPLSMNLLIGVVVFAAICSISSSCGTIAAASCAGLALAPAELPGDAEEEMALARLTSVRVRRCSGYCCRRMRRCLSRLCSRPMSSPVCSALQATRRVASVSSRRRCCWRFRVCRAASCWARCWSIAWSITSCPYSRAHPARHARDHAACGRAAAPARQPACTRAGGIGDAWRAGAEFGPHGWPKCWP